MRNTKASRRHHTARIKARRFKEERSRFTIDDINTEANLQRNVGLRAHTACLCSCWMCGNPRRRYGNARASLTMQELRALDIDESEL